MSTDEQKATGPDLKAGTPINSLKEGVPLAGHADGEQVILVRRGQQVYAVGATCTHYGGPLAEGLVVGDTIRCPWHHARFCLKTGEVEGAPALSPIPCFAVEQTGDSVRIVGKIEPKPVPPPRSPSSVAIVGAGAAGAACVDMLRSKGYAGPIVLIGDEPPGPVDRPNLSKDYLAGTAQEEWVALRTPDYYKSIDVELIMGDPAAAIDTAAHSVTLKSGKQLKYGTLLLAPGSEPNRLNVPGASGSNVFYLRTLADCKAIIDRAEKSKSCVVIGTSFIGMEVAASLRTRNLEVTVVGKGSQPLGNVLGSKFSAFVQKLHEDHGVSFLFNQNITQITDKGVEVEGGKVVEADFVVIGVGVKPRTALAEASGLKVDNGIVTDEMLRTGAPDVYAAGDAANFIEPVTGEHVRIEHWVVAERQGQAVARAMLGLQTAYRDTPFFWTHQYDVPISYVGHAASWDAVEVHGNLDKRDACAIYRKNGATLAVATLGRDHLGLEVEAALESGNQSALDDILSEK